MNAEDFNEIYEIGDQVIYRNDDNSRVVTTIRSLAWELGHGDSVVKVAGKTGGVSVDRIDSQQRIK